MSENSLYPASGKSRKLSGRWTICNFGQKLQSCEVKRRRKTIVKKQILWVLTYMGAMATVNVSHAEELKPASYQATANNDSQSVRSRSYSQAYVDFLLASKTAEE